MSSNPSFVTKLMTLVKDVFGPKDSESEQAKAPAAEKDAVSEPAAEAPEKAETPAAEEGTASAKSEATEPPAEAKKPAPAAEEKTEDTGKAASAPATEDVPEQDEAIARELDTNEDRTEVADAEVLERVRKGAAPAAEDLPVPTYDDLTLPSIRARLRKLTIDQVRDLRAYEVAHHSRPEFVKMYDNRIAKLQAEEG